MFLQFLLCVYTNIYVHVYVYIYEYIHMCAYKKKTLSYAAVNLCAVTIIKHLIPAFAHFHKEN